MSEPNDDGDLRFGIFTAIGRQSERALTKDQQLDFIRDVEDKDRFLWLPPIYGEGVRSLNAVGQGSFFPE